MRVRQVGALVGPLCRAVPWWPLAAAVVLGVLVLLPAVAVDGGPYRALPGLRLAAMLLGAAASFAMVDAMAPTVVAPTPRWLRQWLRCALAVVPAAVAWAALYGTVRVLAGPAALGPGADLTVEALACGLAAVAGAAVAARNRHTATAALAGPLTVGVLVAGSLFLTGSASPWVDPSHPQWDRMHGYWGVAVAVVVVVLLVGNRDAWVARRR